MFLEFLSSRSAITAVITGLLEGMGVPWPGAVFMAAAGGESSGVWSPVLLATWFSLFYTMSSLVQYMMARYGWDQMSRFLSSGLRSRLEHAISRYGEFAVLWTRPFAIGNYVSIPAGIMRMNPAKFLLYTFVGIWPWALGITAAGGVLGRYTDFAKSGLTLVTIGMALMMLAAVIRKRWQRVKLRLH